MKQVQETFYKIILGQITISILIVSLWYVYQKLSMSHIDKLISRIIPYKSDGVIEKYSIPLDKYNSL
jgi:hypothetical protein